MEVLGTWKDVDHPKYQFSQCKVLFSQNSSQKFFNVPVGQTRPRNPRTQPNKTCLCRLEKTQTFFLLPTTSMVSSQAVSWDDLRRPDPTTTTTASGGLMPLFVSKEQHEQRYNLPVKQDHWVFWSIWEGWIQFFQETGTAASSQMQLPLSWNVPMKYWLQDWSPGTLHHTCGVLE